MKNNILIIGWIGVTIIFCAYLYQLVKFLKVPPQGVKISTFLLPLLGCFFWILYGAITSELVITFSNMAFAIVIFFILWRVLRCNNKGWKFCLTLLSSLSFIIISVSVFAIYSVFDKSLQNSLHTVPEWIDYIFSITAGLLISIKLIPLAINVYKNKKASSLSLIFLGLIFSGNVFRFSYSLLVYVDTQKLVITLAPMIFFSLAALMSMILLSFKYLYRDKTQNVNNLTS